jgi:proline dehydrogenase
MPDTALDSDSSMPLNFSFEKLFAGKWIAGAHMEDAIDRARRLNRHGIGTILNYLGEDFKDKKDTQDAVSTYISLIKKIHDGNVRADIAVKPTQIGLSISYMYAAKNYSAILEYARKNGVFVWLDMESHRYVEDTIKLYLEHLSSHKKKDTGICIQSYLRRSRRDISKIVKRNGVIRLVKGAYKESDSIAYANRAEVTENYSKLMKYLFAHADRFTIATHDMKMIELALSLDRSMHKDMTLAMLNGIRNRYALSIAKKENVYIYVPFGSRWVDYSIRRLRELSNAVIIVRSLFSR